MLVGKSELEQDIELGQRQIAAGQQIRLQFPCHTRVLGKERSPRAVLQ
jgi:hypothetical protein